MKHLRSGLPVLEGDFDVGTGKWTYSPMIIRNRNGGRKKKSTYEYCQKVWDEWMKGTISMTKLAKKMNLKYKDVLRVCSKRNYTYIDYFLKYKAEKVARC